VGLIDIDDQTHAYVRFAARVASVTEAEVVARAVAAYLQEKPNPSPPDPWTPVPVYAEYRGHRVEGQFVPRTQRLVVTGEPAPGRSFKSPSGAARAVVAALNPSRESVHTNGWRFWRLVDTDDRLDVLRRRSYPSE